MDKLPLSEFLTEWLNSLLVVTSPSSRLFYIHILISVFALVLWAIKSHISIKDLFKKKIFNQRYWWNKSTRIDYVYFLLNTPLKVAFTLMLLPLSFDFSKVIVHELVRINNGFAYFEFSIFENIVFTIFAFALDDFTRFFYHMLCHRVSILWYFHRIHHSAQVLTPFTVYRSHPVDMCLSVVRQVLINSILSALFIFMFYKSVTTLTLFGVNAALFASDLLVSNLRHSHIPIGFGRFEFLYMSPFQHQIHHSRIKEHHNKNFGDALSIWDFVFGTLLRSERINAQLKFGIRSHRSI